MVVFLPEAHLLENSFADCKHVERISSVLFPVALARRFLPKPGEGPSREVLLNGSFKFRFIAETEEDDGASPTIVQAVVSAEGCDPSYWGTARIVLECALCQILDQAKLKETQSLVGGVLTPATAFGMVAVERLRNAGFHIDIVQD